MRILLLTQLFQPEPNLLRGLSFTRELVRNGHRVQVLTGFPHYPYDRLYPGYRMSWRMREKRDGVPVIRVAMFTSHDRSGLKRFACYASLAVSAALLGPLLVKRADVAYVYQGPATLVLPAAVLKILRGIPFVLDVQDIWPDSVTSSGMLKARWLLPLLNAWCNLTYRLAGKITVLSEGYKTTLINRGVPAGKIEVVYNWCDETILDNLTRDPAYENRLGLTGRFNVVFAGTMGTVQALETVIEAASLLRDELPQVQFVFVGSGVELPRLKDLAQTGNVTNVLFIPRQPSHLVGKILAAGDVLLIHLKDTPLDRLGGIPQKTQVYLAAGKPILMAAGGDAARIVREAGAGLVCKQEDAREIARAVRQLAAMSGDERRKMGENGRRFYQDNFSFVRGVRHVEAILTSLAA